MKISSLLPQDQVFWYLNTQPPRQLTHDIETDILVIGGGMAGLSAAQSFRKKGLNVVLVEKNYCGSGASGKSSGFITPDSELPLRHFVQKYGADHAKKLWDFIASGVALIKNNIHNYSLECDYQAQDTLVLASTQKAFEHDLKKEHDSRLSLTYSSTLYEKDHLKNVIGSHGYHGALTYGETFGIQAYRYCQGMKQVLQDQGVQIFEETPVLELKDHRAITPTATVKAQHIIVCTDHFAAAFKNFKHMVYHAQTCLMISAPLTQAQIKKIFPNKPYMAWDTDLIYNYFRLTGDNRLLLGGASLLDTYATQEHHNNTRVTQQLARYFENKFPGTHIQFEYSWPGLIGISKDLFPLAGYDAQMPSVYYIAAAAGLPWAAALGAYSAEHILEKNTALEQMLSPYRSFPLGQTAQTLLGTKLTFALSNFLTVGSL